MSCSCVSVLILAYNEEMNIAAALRSVAGLSDDIHVVDSGSLDRTVSIAEEHCAIVTVHHYVDHSSQIEWALKHLPFKYEWIFLVDSDFVVTEELKRLIQREVPRAPRECGGFFVAHRYVFRGQPIRFGGTKKWWLRIFRRSAVWLDGSELVDFRIGVEGVTAKLQAAVLEDNKKEYDIDFWIDKHQKFSTRMAAEEIGRRLGVIKWSVEPSLTGNPDQQILWFKQRWYYLPLFVRSFVYFAVRYVLLLGFLDGKQGFVFHFLQGFWFRLLVDVKISNLQQLDQEAAERLVRHAKARATS